MGLAIPAMNKISIIHIRRRHRLFFFSYFQRNRFRQLGDGTDFNRRYLLRRNASMITVMDKF